MTPISKSKDTACLESEGKSLEVNKNRLVAMRVRKEVVVPAQQQFICDDGNCVSHMVQEASDVLLSSALPGTVSGISGVGVVVALRENVELFDEAVVGMHLRST